MTQDEIIASNLSELEKANERIKMLEDKLASIKQAIAELESQEPVAWVDPATLYQLKIGLEGVHLVYETEMVNSLPLYEKPQGWRDNVAQAYLKGFDEGCKSMSARKGTQNIGCLGMPVNVPVTPPQRTEQNFCSRCGKRTADLTTIHTCTPPQD